MKNRRFLIIIFIATLVLSHTRVYAFTDDEKQELYDIAIVGSANGGKEGPKKLVGDSKEVNLIGYEEGGELWEKNRQAIYQEILSWGCTAECAAAITGNINCEGNCDPTCLQSLVAYDKWTLGVTGTGLTQWTYYTRQEGMLRSCEMQNKDWNDLGAQLAYFKWEIFDTKNNYFDFNKYKDSKDINEVVSGFMWAYENPGEPHEDKRKDRAKAIYDAYKDLPPKAYDGSSSSNNTDTGENINGLIGEGDLEGMPDASKLLDDQGAVNLANRNNLTIGEQHSVASMSENMEIQEQINAFNLARRIVMFIGLVLLLYATVMFMAIVFDKANNWFEFSMVKLVSLGRIKYAPNNTEDVLDKRGYVSTKKLVISTSLIFIVGIVIISGSIFSRFSGFAWWLSSKL